MSRPSTREPISDDQREEFLELLADGVTVIDAAEKVGRGRRDFYRLRTTDTEFAAEWRAAWAEGTDRLVAEAQRRAVDGVDEPVFHKGEIVGYVRRLDSTLLMFLIKQRDPSFRENSRVELTGGDGRPIEVKVEHTADDLARVASLLTDAGVLPAGQSPDSEGDEVHPG